MPVLVSASCNDRVSNKGLKPKPTFVASRDAQNSVDALNLGVCCRIVTESTAGERGGDSFSKNSRDNWYHSTSTTQPRTTTVNMRVNIQLKNPFPSLYHYFPVHHLISSPRVHQCWRNRMLQRFPHTWGSLCPVKLQVYY